MVISGDLLTDFNLKKIIDFHVDRKASATITLTSVKDPLQFGVVITDKEKRISQFLEKPGWGEVISDTINTGIYVLEPSLLKYVPKNKPYDMPQLFERLIEEKQVAAAFPIREYWLDIGQMEDFKRANGEYQKFFG